MILGWLLTGFESFLLRPVGKVGILSLNLNFKREFFGELELKVGIFCKNLNFEAGVLNFWGRCATSST